MTRLELDFILRLLERIKDPDEQVEKAKAYINKDLKMYDSRRGQLRDQYEVDYPRW